MPATNVELSKKELELVVNSEFILTKNRIIQKVYDLFGVLSEDFRKILNSFSNSLPGEMHSSSPKIYKGENYLGLPYIMMDHPRFFNKDDAFAIRCFFWWGNYFSITLQLSGKFFNQYKAALSQFIKNKQNEAYFICVNTSPWEHHFEESNYKPFNAVPSEEILQKEFVKIAARLPLNKWNDAEIFFRKQYREFIEMLIRA
jgi:hypothetical protein